jgi:hypothetical protein
MHQSFDKRWGDFAIKVSRPSSCHYSNRHQDQFQQMQHVAFVRTLYFTALYRLTITTVA